jgi:ABC-2 type transport system ATP-binding protein
VQLAPGAALPELPHIVSCSSDGHFHVLTTNQFGDEHISRLGNSVRNVHRMNLEEIFVATVMHHREARGQ